MVSFFSEEISLIAVSPPFKQVSAPVLIQPGRSLNGELLSPRRLVLSCISAEQLALAVPLCLQVLLCSPLEQHVWMSKSP